MGRHSEYTKEKAESICKNLAEGLSLRQISQIEGMPDKTTVLRWLANNEDFRIQYACARVLQTENMADEIMEIADDGSNDWMKRAREDGSIDEILNHEHIQRSKLRIETRRWLMGKLQPKKYGDKQTIEHEINTDEVAALLRARARVAKIKGEGDK